MKRECKACGYVHEVVEKVLYKAGRIIITSEYELLTGDAPFIHIYNSYNSQLNAETQNESGYQGAGKVNLYACPKCHTVIMFYNES